MTTTRRRFLCITAAALAAPSAALAAHTAHWQGRAMGAPARLTISGLAPKDARPIFAALEAELERLEQIFSLFRADSTLSWLNRTGRFVAPPPELFDVFFLADRLHRASGGAFDPTVLPLFDAGTFGRAQARIFGLIGWDNVRIDPREISFARQGMAITLNGVAQGYINDKIADLLRAHGLNDVMLDIGELQAKGECPLQRPWKARLFAADGAYQDHVVLRDRAVSTTRPNSVVRPGGGRQVVCPKGHMPYHSIVTVSAPTSALADGLSTALALVPREKTLGVVAQFRGARIEMIR